MKIFWTSLSTLTQQPDGLGGGEVTDTTIPIVRLSENGCFISINLKIISPKTYTAHTHTRVSTSTHNSSHLVSGVRVTDIRTVLEMLISLPWPLPPALTALNAIVSSLQWGVRGWELGLSTSLLVQAYESWEKSPCHLVCLHHKIVPAYTLTLIGMFCLFMFWPGSPIPHSRIKE